mmetsp:Transcript_2207/g.8556  ORF Transcript_2207/g.8556 Transcript_2207/m.8556 type:complete len:265 (+) Transcript_2207:323-1117(+)
MLVEGDLLGFDRRIDVLEVRTVQLGLLLLHVSAEGGQGGGHLGTRLPEHVRQLTRPRLVVLGEERVRKSCLPRATGSANAVHVILGGEGKGVVDDVLDTLDVQASRGDVGGDQKRAGPVLERLHGKLAVPLRHVAVDASRLPVLPLQVLVQPRALLLVQRKHEGPGHGLLTPEVLLQDPTEVSVLIVGLHDLHHLRHGVRRLETLRADPHLDRIAHKLGSQALDGRGPRGGEHDGLAVRAGLAGDLPDFGLEPEVQHPVRLVEH